VRLETDQSYSSRPILIEDGASNYLKNELDIDVKSLSGSGSKWNLCCEAYSEKVDSIERIWGNY